MKTDRTQKEVIRIYEKYYGSLYTISYNKEGKRVLTYGCLSIYKAIAEKLRQEAMGHTSYIIQKREGMKITTFDNNMPLIKELADNFAKEFEGE